MAVLAINRNAPGEIPESMTMMISLRLVVFILSLNLYSNSVGAAAGQREIRPYLFAFADL